MELSTKFNNTYLLYYNKKEIKKEKLFYNCIEFCISTFS